LTATTVGRARFALREGAAPILIITKAITAGRVTAIIVKERLGF